MLQEVGMVMILAYVCYWVGVGGRRRRNVLLAIDFAAPLLLLTVNWRCRFLWMSELVQITPLASLCLFIWFIGWSQHAFIYSSSPPHGINFTSLSLALSYLGFKKINLSPKPHSLRYIPTPRTMHTPSRFATLNLSCWLLARIGLLWFPTLTITHVSFLQMRVWIL